MDSFKVLLMVAAFVAVIASTSAVWIYLEPSELVSRYSDLADRYAQVSYGPGESAIPVRIPEGASVFAQQPVKRNSEILNTLIGLPAKLRQHDCLVRLLTDCAKAKGNAYAQYSNFRVGAALLTSTGSDGVIIPGCNVENASSGLTVCAERTAVCSMVAKGLRTFHCIAVTSDVQDQFCTPCGMCRQVILEFAPNALVILMKPGFSMEDYVAGHGLRIISNQELLPLGFTPADLKRPKISQNADAAPPVL